MPFPILLSLTLIFFVSIHSSPIPETLKDYLPSTFPDDPQYGHYLPADILSYVSGFSLSPEQQYYCKCQSIFGFHPFFDSLYRYDLECVKYWFLVENIQMSSCNRLAMDPFSMLLMSPLGSSESPLYHPKNGQLSIDILHLLLDFGLDVNISPNKQPKNPRLCFPVLQSQMCKNIKISEDPLFFRTAPLDPLDFGFSSNVFSPQSHSSSSKASTSLTLTDDSKT